MAPPSQQKKLEKVPSGGSSSSEEENIELQVVEETEDGSSSDDQLVHAKADTNAKKPIPTDPKDSDSKEEDSTSVDDDKMPTPASKAKPKAAKRIPSEETESKEGRSSKKPRRGGEGKSSVVAVVKNTEAEVVLKVGKVVRQGNRDNEVDEFWSNRPFFQASLDREMGNGYVVPDGMVDLVKKQFSLFGDEKKGDHFEEKWKNLLLEESMLHMKMLALMIEQIGTAVEYCKQCDPENDSA